MAFREAERVQLRRWMGFPGVGILSDMRLEEATNLVQSKADGGLRPDSSTEDAIRGYLAELDAIEGRIRSLAAQLVLGRTDEVNLDAARAIQGLRALGRMYTGHLSDALGMRPLRDAFQGVQACAS